MNLEFDMSASKMIKGVKAAHTWSGSQIRCKREKGIICHSLVCRPDISECPLDQNQAWSAEKSSEETEGKQGRNAGSQTDNDHAKSEERETGKVDGSTSVCFREMWYIDGREKRHHKRAW